MTSDIADAIRAAQGLTAKLRELQGLASYGELLAAANAVQEKLTNALISNAAAAEEKLLLLQRIHTLEQEKNVVDEWRLIAGDYQLKAVAEGFFAYVYKPITDSGQPRHWACPQCYQNRQRAVLQYRLSPPAYECPACRLVLRPYTQGHIATIDSAYEQ